MYRLTNAISVIKSKILFLFSGGGGGWGFMFFNSTFPTRSPIGLVSCVPSYTLSFPAFKGLNHRMSFIFLYFKNLFWPCHWCVSWHFIGKIFKSMVWQIPLSHCGELPLIVICSSCFKTLILDFADWKSNKIKGTKPDKHL